MTGQPIGRPGGADPRAYLVSKLFMASEFIEATTATHHPGPQPPRDATPPARGRAPLQAAAASASARGRLTASSSPPRCQAATAGGLRLGPKPDPSARPRLAVRFQIVHD